MLTALPASIPPLAGLLPTIHVSAVVLHWLAMNVLVASAWHLASARATDLGLQRRMASAVPRAFTVAGLFGLGALLLLRQENGARIETSAGHMVSLWAVALGVLVLGIGVTHIVERRARQGVSAPRWMRYLPFVALVFFAFTLTWNLALSEHPHLVANLASTGWAGTLLESGVLPRFLHHLVGSVALGSIWLLHVGLRVRAQDAERGESLMKRAAFACMIGTAVAVVFGIWQLLHAPKEVGGAVPGAMLAVGVMAGLAVPGFMAVAWKRGASRLVTMSWIAIAVTLAAKAILRRAIRVRRLEDGAEGTVPALPEATDATMLWIACALAAVGMLGWFISRRLRRGEAAVGA